MFQEFEDNFKAKKDAKKRKSSRMGGGESGTEDSATPPPPAGGGEPKRPMHPGEEMKIRGFDRGLQVMKIPNLEHSEICVRSPKPNIEPLKALNPLKTELRTFQTLSSSSKTDN